MSPFAVREALHRLLDELPDEELPAARRFLEFLRSLVRPAQGSTQPTPGEEFDHESLVAWDQYKATGKHAADEDVLAWLRSWGTDEELPAPGLIDRPRE